MSNRYYETLQFVRHGRLLRATLIGQEPWFAARDLARLLGVSSDVRLNEGLDADQWRDGLLKCGRSLRHWLTHEVIPALRAPRRLA